MDNRYLFHHGWRFLLSGTFPLEKALKAYTEGTGRSPVDPDYDDRDWENVTLPHTFNDKDLFSVPIEDGGSGQVRTCVFYRNTLRLPPEHRHKRVFLVFEGVRQTCYVYVNGSLAGYYEMGVGPFGFDLTPFIHPEEDNLIAIASDNTSTRNIPFCIAETPNKTGVAPGSYLQSQDQKVPPDREGVGFFWNCNDFNPTLGGLSQNVYVYFKEDVHLTLPIYANLQSHGCYIYADHFDFVHHTACIHIEAEIRNLSSHDVTCHVTARVRNRADQLLAQWTSDETSIPSMPYSFPLSVVPEDAYKWDPASAHYVPEDEDKVRPSCLESLCTARIAFSQVVSGLTFWEPAHPELYRVELLLQSGDKQLDSEEIETGFRHVRYDKDQGICLNGHPVWLRGYAQRASNEWAASGIVPEWMHDQDAKWVRESGANHIRWMHVAANPVDIRACDRQGIVCTQPAGDKERETFGRQWDQRIELMRNTIIAFRNHPSILFWEAGNNVISTGHMREMRQLKQILDPFGGRFMGCRTINTEDTLAESEYVGTMLNRHAARFLAEHGPVTETEYSREEAPRRVWDDYTPPDYDYRNRFLGKGGRKQKGLDFYDLTSEDLALENARGYSEFFFDRIGGASGKNLYSACAALCWTDSAQHGRQSYSENGRMSGRVDAIRVKKQSFDVFRVMHSASPAVKILGHWNYPPLTPSSYRAFQKVFNGSYWEETGTHILRDPENKTVYCAASYPVKKVELYINGRPAGCCMQPQYGFIFAFPSTDITQSGEIRAIGYDYNDCAVCEDRIVTCGSPAHILLTAHTSCEGWLADGNDLCYVDIAITDEDGRICPLADMRIDFVLTGPAQLLGGYNSGRFEGNGRHDNVIHQPFVFAECGVNRVLLRSDTKNGTVQLKASAPSLPSSSITLHTVPAENTVLSLKRPCVHYPNEGELPPASEDIVLPVSEADQVKYVPEPEPYCKVMVNGQEPDFRGIRAVHRNGRVWGNVLCILERIRSISPQCLSYTWDPTGGTLSRVSMGHTIVVRTGVTHMVIDGQENLMDGQPYTTPEGILVMEITALVPFLYGAQSLYDDRIGALRITVSSSL